MTSIRAMKELDYRPNSVARSLRSRKSKIISLFGWFARCDCYLFLQP
ncbi:MULTISPECIES: hypothetical protein [unclassified Paenibacillus]|nr:MULTISPECIES: hypothetical protein [unclassified Paenibacillus]